MWTYNCSQELMHYGVPGMKWGHRKARSTSDGIKRTGGSAKDVKKGSQAAKKMVEQKTKKKETKSITSGQKKTSSKKKTAKKSVKKKTAAKAANVVGKSLKMTYTTATRMYANQKAYDAVGNLLDGDFGSAFYNGNLSRYAYNASAYPWT